MMRAIAAFLLLLAGGAEGRLPLFGHGCKYADSTPDAGTLIREAYAGSASKICPPSHEMVWVLTDYDGNQWTKLDQYIMPGVTCEGNCPLALTQGRDAGAPGWCK